MLVILIPCSFASTRKGMFPSLRVTELGVFASFIIIPCKYLTVLLYIYICIIIIVLYLYFWFIFCLICLNHQQCNCIGIKFHYIQLYSFKMKDFKQIHLYSLKYSIFYNLCVQANRIKKMCSAPNKNLTRALKDGSDWKTKNLFFN